MYRYYNMVTEDKKAYMKQYYDANKTPLIQQITQRQRLIRNSDKHIEGNEGEADTWPERRHEEVPTYAHASEIQY